MLYFARDHIKIEAMDENTSIITIQCPNEISKELITLLDTLSAASRWVTTQIRMERCTLVNKALVRE